MCVGPIPVLQHFMSEFEPLWIFDIYRGSWNQVPQMPRTDNKWIFIWWPLYVYEILRYDPYCNFRTWGWWASSFAGRIEFHVHLSILSSFLSGIDPNHSIEVREASSPKPSLQSSSSTTFYASIISMVCVLIFLSPYHLCTSSKASVFESQLTVHSMTVQVTTLGLALSCGLET